MIFRQLAAAKINLFLEITGKRGDGYHELYSLVCFTKDFGDIIEAKQSTVSSLKIDGEFGADVPNNDNNIILNTIRQFNRCFDCDLQLEISLQKNIPVAAGIGGGSSDAAAIIRILEQLAREKGITFTISQIMNLCLNLGADVPMCYHSKPQLVSGIGEILQDINIPALNILLVNPRKELLTKDVFSRFRLENNSSINEYNTGEEITAFIGRHHNRLETAAIGLEPEVKIVLNILAEMEGCWLARMSGSGATCFGVFDTELNTQSAQEQINKIRPDYWCRACAVAD